MTINQRVGSVTSTLGPEALGGCRADPQPTGDFPGFQPSTSGPPAGMLTGALRVEKS